MKSILKFYSLCGGIMLLASFNVTELYTLDQLTVSANEQPKDDCEKSKNSDCISSDGNIYIGMSKTKTEEVEPLP